MDRTTLIQAYIKIETKTYVRSDKTKKLNDFVDKIKASDYVLTLEDTRSIVKSFIEQNVTIRHTFFQYIISPVLIKGVEENNIDAFIQLIQLFDRYSNFQSLTSDNKYTIWTLLSRAVQLAPFNEELLTTYEQHQKRHLEYTLHELPVGVVYNTNGASKEECTELLKDLSDYEETCQKLNLNRQEFIHNCRFYYESYNSYLDVYENYNGFSDYLKKRDAKSN
jgi:hypothetical protein